MSLVEVAVVVEEGARMGRVAGARELCLREGKWYGQLCACGKNAVPVQLNRLEEVSDGKVDCSVEVFVLFSSLFRLAWEEELCSGGVVGGDGWTECSRETLTVDEQTNFARPGP